MALTVAQLLSLRAILVDHRRCVRAPNFEISKASDVIAAYEGLGLVAPSVEEIESKSALIWEIDQLITALEQMVQEETNDM